MRRTSPEKIVEALPAALEKVRLRGARVGVAEAVEIARILRSYAALRREEKISEDDLRLVVRGVVKSDEWAEALIEEIKRVIARKELDGAALKIKSEIMARLEAMGARPGARVTKKDFRRFKDKKRRREALSSYLKLKRLGLIRHVGGREVIADSRVIDEVSRRLAKRGYTSIEEALSSGEPPGSWDSMLMHAEVGEEVDYSKIDAKRLVDMGFAAKKKGNKRMLARIAQEISARVSRGERVGASTVYRLLKDSNMLDQATLKGLISQEPSLAAEAGLDPEVLSRVISSLGDEKAAETVAKYLKRANRREAISLLERIDPRLLWMARRAPFEGAEEKLFRAASMAAAGLRDSIAYLETGNPGRKEASLDNISRALRILSSISDDVSLGSINKSIVYRMAEAAATLSAIDEGISARWESLGKVLLRLDMRDVITVLKSLYNRGSGLERLALLRFAERILGRYVSARGIKPLPRIITTESRSPRIDVKKSIYRSVRMAQNPIVYRRRLKSGRLVLVVDKSGSMMEYSSWAIAVASMFASNIDRLVLFSHEVEVYEGPLTRLELLEVLFKTSFSGYTDIAGALKAAPSPRTRKIVLLSDLKQTVSGEDPYLVAESLVRRGYKLIVITTIGHDEALKKRLESLGVCVFPSPSPRHAALRIVRELIKNK